MLVMCMIIHYNNVPRPAALDQSIQRSRLQIFGGWIVMEGEVIRMYHQPGSHNHFYGPSFDCSNLFAFSRFRFRPQNPIMYSPCPLSPLRRHLLSNRSKNSNTKRITSPGFSCMGTVYGSWGRDCQYVNE